MARVAVSTDDAMRRAVERWAPKLVEDEDGHWLWPGALNDLGNGLLRLPVAGRVKTVKAARVFWEVMVGPIPDGHNLRSVCGRPDCVRPHPDHREPITPEELGRVTTNPMALNAQKVECQNGHPLKGDLADVYVYPNGGRECRRCRRDYQREHRGARTAQETTEQLDQLDPVGEGVA